MRSKLVSLCLPAVIGALVLAPRPAAAKYLPIPLLDRAVRADVIVLGRIVEVLDSTYILEVGETIKGPNGPGARLEIVRFVDWTCASRGEPYLVGQALLVFLDEEPGEGQPLHRAPGAGAEGEARIISGGIYLRAAPGEPAFVVTDGGLVSGQRWTARIVVDALRSLLAVVRAERFDERLDRLQLIPGREDSARLLLTSMNPLLVTLATELLELAQ